MADEMADTRDIVQELLRRIAEGDHDGAAGMFAEQIDWRLSWPAEGHPEVPWIGHDRPGPRWPTTSAC
ncbi:hypothetical protein [Nonomuraea diastatica]|uniref:hypothetical protein n=1 Tax=Nonomuraea diastatica TaxID=1848329 RepID=UPI001FEA00E4|nr:hypothetical protein [Nonomuraea diastatica]